MLYTVPYMSSTRTQIYLTEEQRTRLDELARREDKSLALIIREAVDAYLARRPDADDVLNRTFGTMPDLIVPSRDEWDRY